MSCTVIKGITALLLIVAGMQLHAQSNILVGYKFAYVDPLEVNAIYDAYNSQQQGLEVSMPMMHSLNGLAFGYRYRFGKASVELAWSNVGADQKAQGINPMTGGAFEKRMLWSLTQYDLGLNFHAKAFMYGAGIGYRHVKAETDLPGLDEVNRTLLDDNHWVANASIGIEVKSKAIAFAIQPYATYPLMETDVAPIETDLVGSTTSSRLEDFLVFGVRLTLYNGKQHRN